MSRTKVDWASKSGIGKSLIQTNAHAREEQTKRGRHARVSELPTASEETDLGPLQERIVL